jgi:hypothetical protein
MASTPADLVALDGLEHPVHKILNRLESNNIAPRTGPFAEHTA